MADLLVKKACKDYAKTMGMRFPDSAIEKLDGIVKQMVGRAGERAEANGRVTIQGQDL